MRGRKPEDLKGQKFGRLVAEEYAGRLGGRSAWRCRCDCGNETLVGARHLKFGDVASCGCLAKDERKGRPTRHGHARANRHTITYTSWQNMRRRCDYPKCKGYPYYGGKGIQVCERWHSFENFLKDMGPRPSNRHQISRKDHDADYAPDNCEWGIIGTH